MSQLDNVKVGDTVYKVELGCRTLKPIRATKLIARRVTPKQIDCGEHKYWKESGYIVGNSTYLFELSTTNPLNHNKL